MKKKTTERGLRIITVPTKNTKVATVLVLVKTGSKNEEKRTSGISHFLEHMFFKGTKKRPNILKLTEDFDKLGGEYNAFTAEDYTGYYAKVNFLQLPKAIELVSDIYLNSLLPEKEIEKEKGVIKEEINMRYDDPMINCITLFQELLYGDQPAGWDIAGTKNSVSSISRKDLVDYMNSQYVASNTVVVVSGNIKEKEVTEKVSSLFSQIRKGKPKEKQKVKEAQNKPRALVFGKKTEQTHLCLGVRGFNLFYREKYVQKVIAVILGGMMSSRLFGKVREEMGAAYYIATSVESNPDTGVLYTQAGVDNDKTKDVIRAIVREYKRMKEERVPAKELKKAKDYLKGRSAIKLETSDSLAKFYGMAELFENKTHSVEDVFNQIDKVTTNDILKVAKQVFTPENINLSLVGPRKTKKELEEILNEV